MITRIDPLIDFSWGTKGPDATIGNDTFSVRWTGYVMPLYNEMYTFYIKADDGARLWIGDTIGNQQLIDNWQNPIAEDYGIIALRSASRYSIVIEYYEKDNRAGVELWWSSPSQRKQIVPANRLKH